MRKTADKTGRTAQDIYNQQNKIIHRALGEMGMAYRNEKTEICKMFANALGRRRPINGLSILSLGERYKIIKYLRTKGLKVFNPFIGRNLWQWRKGRTDKPRDIVSALVVEQKKQYSDEKRSHGSRPKKKTKPLPIAKNQWEEDSFVFLIQTAPIKIRKEKT